MLTREDYCDGLGRRILMRGKIELGGLSRAHRMRRRGSGADSEKFPDCFHEDNDEIYRRAKSRVRLHCKFSKYFVNSRSLAKFAGQNDTFRLRQGLLPGDGF